MTILVATEYPEFAAITGRACRKCGSVKPLAQFSKAPRGKYGRKASCKACDAARYLRNPNPSRALPADELATRKAARKATKKCTRCGQAKPRDEYDTRTDPRYEGGVDTWCRTCVGTEFINDAERQEMAALGLVGQPCACGCGEMTKVDVRRKRVGKYISGHNSRVAPPMPPGSKHTDEAREKIRAARALQENVVGPNVERRDEMERFLAMVNKDAPRGCWEWTGACCGNGYGAFGTYNMRGRVAERGERMRIMRAHRFSYENLVGPVPEGLELDHLCSNRKCVNPDHLDPVTHQENIRRAVRRRDRWVRLPRFPA